MLKPFLSGVMGMVLVFVGGGVAAADPNVGDATGSKVTADGYHMSASITQIAITPVPSANGSGFTREGFIDATANLTVVCGDSRCSDDKAPVTTGTLSVWANVGCQIAVPNGAQLNYNPTFSTSLPGGANLGEILNPPGTPGASNDITDIALAPTVGQNGTIVANVLPGTIDDNPSLGKKGFPPKKAPKEAPEEPAPSDGSAPTPPNPGPKELDVSQGLVISVQGAHVVRACAGPVFIRLHATATMSTAQSDDTLDLYSAILPL